MGGWYQLELQDEPGGLWNRPGTLERDEGNSAGGASQGLGTSEGLVAAGGRRAWYGLGGLSPGWGLQFQRAASTDVG